MNNTKPVEEDAGQVLCPACGDEDCKPGDTCNAMTPEEEAPEWPHEGRHFVVQVVATPEVDPSLYEGATEDTLFSLDAAVSFATKHQVDLVLFDEKSGQKTGNVRQDGDWELW